MRKDILLFKDDKLSLGGQSMVSGTRLLAQRAVLELLTDEGSMPYLPDAGCSFRRRLKHGITEFDVTIAFAAARAKIKRRLNADITAETPPQERFANMRLNEVILDGDYISLNITVFSRAKTAVRITTPPILLE